MKQPEWKWLDSGRRALVCQCGQSHWKVITQHREYTALLECLSCETQVRVSDLPEAE